MYNCTGCLGWVFLVFCGEHLCTLRALGSGTVKKVIIEKKTLNLLCINSMHSDRNHNIMQLMFVVFTHKQIVVHAFAL